MIADDLFAGAGGWDIAAAALGIRARGVENMREARATRDAAGLETVHDDVWTYEPDGTALGLIASPPCQTFSAAGKGHGRKNLDVVLRAIYEERWKDIAELHSFADSTGDNRTGLVLTPLHFALGSHGYRWLAWEQVPTVLPVWKACRSVLEDHGWSVWTGNLQAEQYGVPQTRKRAVLVASLDREVAPPVPTHSRYHNRTPDRLDEGVLPWVSMAEALSWEEPAEVVSNYGTGGDARNRGTRSSDQPAATVTEKVGRNKVYRANKMKNGAWRTGDQPAPTVAFGHDAASVRWFPAEVRVSVEEASILQSFPADHPWQGAEGKRYLQVGNAVPPLLAAHVLKAATGA